MLAALCIKMLARILRRSIDVSQNLQPLTHRYFCTFPVAATGNENPILAEYLVKSLGFPRDTATRISQKFTGGKSTERPKKIVDYLRTSGFSDSQIRNLVNYHPRVLFNSVEKTLQPKLRAFESLGLPGSYVRVALSSNPLVLARGLRTQILPALKTLKSFFTIPENVFLVAVKYQRFLCTSTRSFMTANVRLLKRYGVPMERVEKLTVQGNRFLYCDPSWLECVLRRVEEELHIPRKLSMFLHAVCVLTSINNETINSKLEICKSFGWSEKEFFQMVRRLPYTLRTSEDTMRVRLKYFMEELGFESSYLAARPVFLLLSTEKRVKPRYHVMKVLKEKQLFKSDPNLYTFVCATETDFLNKYVIPFDKQVPGLYDDYVAMTKRKKGDNLLEDV